MEEIAFLILLLFVLIQHLTLWAVEFKIRNEKASFVELPKVTILLAARNEEKYIIRSLTSIANLNFPMVDLEVLIGNDQSTDNTAKLIENFIADKPNFKLFHIEQNKGRGRGKANVIAHLAHHATGQFYFITDVDVALPKEWINELLNEFEDQVGIVSGTTTCAADNSRFSIFQSIDWLHFMGYMQSFANMGVSCTSVGNNMAVRDKAYWQTGGFEKIQFSITEDYKLFEAVTKRGWQWRTILTPGSLGLASAIPTWSEMLHQRKRWLIGAKDLTWDWKLIILLYGLFLPALVVMFFFNPIFAIGIFLLKFIIQLVYINKLTDLVAMPRFSVKQILFYEGFLLANTMITAAFFFLPIKTIWKGRVYSQKDLR